MDWYLIAKYLHVALATVWLGGGFVLVLLGILADRARDEGGLMAVVAQVVRVAPIVFVPGSVLVLLSGLAMIWLGGWAWEAWIAFGLVGIAFTALFGALVLGPMSGRVAALDAEGQRGAAVTLGRRLLRLARVDYLAQFTIVFAMVVKPGWSDLAVLGGMVAVLALGTIALMWPAHRGAEHASGAV